jgi:fatty acid desaturase
LNLKKTSDNMPFEEIKLKILEHISAQELKSFLIPSNWRGMSAVLFDWSIITGALVIVAKWPNPLTILLSLIIIGGRQLGLAILVHDTTHYSLFKTRWLNDMIGRWICGGAIWQDQPRYRAHHIKHHKHTGSDKDPDLSLIAGFPVSKDSLKRKLMRDLFGITGVKRLYGLLLMDLGFITYTVAADPKPIDQKGKSLGDILSCARRNLFPVILTNALFFLTLIYFEKPWLYLIWLGAYLTTFSLFLRIRSIAEHACTQLDLDPFKNTRTTLANYLARMTVAPHRVNFHLEHHLLMTVPYFRLPNLHSLLKSRGALKEAYISNGYLEMLRGAIQK